MDVKYNWKTEDIFENEEEFNKCFRLADEKIDFSAYKGKLDTRDGFALCMKAQEEVSRLIDKLCVYAHMKHDENTKDSHYDGLCSKTISLAVKFNTETAFFLPELTALDTEKLIEYKDDPTLKDYDYFLATLLKEKEHVLSENEESLLALAGESLSSFSDIFTKIDNADLPLKPFTFDGEEISMSHGAYGEIMHSPNRALRKEYFERYYSAYKGLINTISATYTGSVKKDVFYAKARNYGSALESALIGEDVPTVVYKNLLESVNDSLPLLHDFIREKKKVLGLKEMRMYDIYAPMAENKDIKLEYDDAYNLVVEGLSVLGKEYRELLKKAHDERWISVYETDGKRSGAYSTAVYDTHPYVLLNYHKTTNDVFTIAHEMGHSIHSYYSNKNQPYFKADYKIFVAEVASTVNEVLLSKYLLKNAKDRKLKKYLLSYLLEMIRTTLYRQTQFAEFEEFSHATIENGNPLTKDVLSEKYFEINKKYYGDAINYDEDIKYEWARIPHFYRAFYVYKYATGIISALAIAERILTEGEIAVKDYFKFLSSGNSDGPINLLKIAGVDLTEKEPFVKAFKVFADALNEFKSL